MSWHSVRGHDRVVEELRQGLAQGRFPHAFLFVGPEGIRDYMHRFLDQWERLTSKAKELTAVGSDTVLAEVVQHGRGRASGSRVTINTSSSSHSGEERSCEWRAS